MLGKLTPKQEVFCREYLIDLNGTQAAIRAGYSRAPKPLRGLPVVSMRQVADAVKSGWKNAPPIVVVQDMSDAQIPQEVRDYNDALESQGATGEPEGFFHDGNVYLVARQLTTPSDVVRVLAHEALGHAGLHGLFGDALTPILHQVAKWRAAELAATAKDKGFDLSKPADVLRAAEELLVDMAQKTPELGFVKRAIAAIRAWLRQHVPGFGGLSLSDNDIIAQFILPARDFIRNGPQQQATGLAPAFSLKAQPGVAETFAQAVDAAMASLRTVVKPIPLGNTPAVLQRLGAPDLEVTISRDVIRKATNKVRHFVTMDAIKALPEQLANPVMVFDSKSEVGSLVVLTEFNDSKGDPVIAAVHLSKTVGLKLEVNQITSVYGRNPASQITGWMRDGLLRYQNQEKSRAWLTDRGLQLPKAQIHGGKASVLTDADFVNPDQNGQGGATSFSRATTPSPNVNPGNPIVTNLREYAHKTGNVLAHFRSLALQGLGRRQIVEIYQGDLPTLKPYSETMSLMDANKHESDANADRQESLVKQAAIAVAQHGLRETCYADNFIETDPLAP